MRLTASAYPLRHAKAEEMLDGFHQHGFASSRLEAAAPWLRFLDLSGVVIGGPSEWTPALLEVLLPTETWDEIRLWRQGQELELSLHRFGTQKRIVADLPRSGTGNYRLRLDGPKLFVEQIVTIVPQKISLEADPRLLDDVTTRLPAAVALWL